MLDIDFSSPDHCEPMPSLNHSYICVEILKQLLTNPEIQPLPELTLDIGHGLTPDISVFLKHQIKPNFLKDIVKLKEMPILAIEIISPRQNIQDVLDKALLLTQANVKAVWGIEPYGRTIFVTTPDQQQILHESVVETEGIRVDFSQIWPKG
jgi:Uma2 family endonuclease